MLFDCLNLSKLNFGTSFNNLFNNIRSGNSVTAFGVPFSSKCLAVSLTENQSVYVCSNMIEAKRYYEELCQIAGHKNVVLIEPKQDVLLSRKIIQKQVVFSQIESCYKLLNKKAKIVVVPVEALTQKFISKLSLKKNILILQKGEQVEIESLCKKLVEMGYSREGVITAKGQFCVRGEIVDIFPINRDNPIRIDFFDVEIESIKAFDLTTSQSKKSKEKVLILPATDVFFEKGQKQQIMDKLKKDANTNAGIFSKQNQKDLTKAINTKNEILEEIISNIENNDNNLQMQFINCYSNNVSTLFEYLESDAVLFLDEPKHLMESLDLVYSQHFSRFENLFLGGEVFLEHINSIQKKDVVVANLLEHTRVAFQLLFFQSKLMQSSQSIRFSINNVSKYNESLKELISDLKEYQSRKFMIVLCGESKDTCLNMQKTLDGYGIESIIKDDIQNFECGIFLITKELNNGFVIDEAKLIVVGSGDLMKKRKATVRIAKSKKDVFVAPQVNDYVVHEVYGIGICRGIKQLDAQFGLNDFVVIEYNGGDVLYVPVDQMNVLAKYSGSENPKLSKIGANEFEKLKAKVKSQISTMAIDLHKLYLERSKRKGFVFASDCQKQVDFENSFEFVETDDQLKAIEDIKKDMESDKPTDRLLCGDVGFGKTEVALRAIFKAVMNGKQCAFLSPTTILSEQHFNTAKSRFAGFDVRVEVLNRFKNEKEQQLILQKLKNGEIDVLVGTHRILSRDVEFKNLGFVVIDEEQRFGVEHKEKLKAMKDSIDVLTLSATPIPRTLHMSMVGIRDISVLQTPPNERLPVQTYVMPESDTLMQDAIAKEIARGGQVFVLYNNVESINSFAFHLSSLIPEAKILVAHGQMPKQHLEKVIIDFYNNQADVLCCSTIIENGIDLPNANTLLVVDSDKLGLSQLYQLRGRVGRSNRQASCYFMFKENKMLKQQAYKRLEALSQNSSLGSGFKIAMRDLEIRGAGDVLGAKQSGHMSKVGYDMYVKLLKECVSEMQGIETNSIQTVIEANFPAFIAENYISNEEQRMTVYRRISEIQSQEQKKNLISMLNETYGVVQEGIYNLIDISFIKNLANKLCVSKVIIKKNQAVLHFADNRVLQNISVLDAVEDIENRAVLAFDEKPKIVISTNNDEQRAIFKKTLKFLKNCEIGV